MATKTKRKPVAHLEPLHSDNLVATPNNVGSLNDVFTDPSELEALVRRFPHAIKGRFFTMPCFDHKRGQGIDAPLDSDINLASPIGELVSGENAARTLNALHSLARMKNLPEHNFFVLDK